MSEQREMVVVKQWWCVQTLLPSGTYYTQGQWYDTPDIPMKRDDKLITFWTTEPVEVRR